MDLKSFREILLKKAEAEGDPQLELLVEYISAERLAAKAIESLKKMARLTRAASRNPNPALLAYAGGMDNSDVSQLRDALGHHIAHYRGALKAYHAATDPTEKAKLRSVADQHLNKIVPMSHLAARAEHHSNGAIAADLPPIRSWQANYTGTHKFPSGPLDENGKVTFKDPVTNENVGPGEPGKEVIGTEGWGGRPTKSRKAGHDQNKSRATPDYRYLEMPPHPEHESLSETKHRGGFPFEDIRVGSSADIDAGKGHLHIPDVGEVKEYVPHEFDKHPIHQAFDVSGGKFSPEMKSRFANDLANWKGSKEHQGWLDRHEGLENEDLEGYMKRGSEKPEHFFKDLPLAQQPEHARGSQAPSEAAPAAAPAQASPTAPQAAAPKASAKQPIDEEQLAAMKRHWDALPPEQKAKYLGKK